MSPIRFCYQTIEFGKLDIHLRTLRNKQQYFDKNGVAEKLGISSAMWPMFGVVWPSSVVLANYLLDFEIKYKRILEVGCGIGLVSLLLNSRIANITATDFHPEVEQFLKVNVRLNNGKEIPFKRTGWDDNVSTLGKFDLIVGSDLLYENEHFISLSGFINQHAKSDSEVILVDPRRGSHSLFSKKMVSLGYSHSQYKVENTPYLEKPFNGLVLKYKR